MTATSRFRTIGVFGRILQPFAMLSTATFLLWMVMPLLIGGEHLIPNRLHMPWQSPQTLQIWICNGFMTVFSGHRDPGEQVIKTVIAKINSPVSEICFCEIEINHLWVRQL